jgi:hypothetical protein
MHTLLVLCRSLAACHVMCNFPLGRSFRAALSVPSGTPAMAIESTLSGKSSDNDTGTQNVPDLEAKIASYTTNPLETGLPFQDRGDNADTSAASVLSSTRQDTDIP